MNMKKVLMTASVWSHIRCFHLPYLEAFQHLGWETHVACTGIPAGAPHVDVAIELPFKKQMIAPENLGAAHILRRRIRSERYDLIIAHTTLAAFFTRLAVKGMKSRPKLVNVMHGYLFDDETPALKRGVLLSAERLVAPQTDLLLVMNEWDYRAALKYRLGRRVEMIPGMGVDFSRLDRVSESREALRDRFGVPRDAFVLLYAAEFSRRKSQDITIRAMNVLPGNNFLVLCGEGATLEACKALATALGVENRALFPGQVSDMAPWYRIADIAVSASRSEGLPFNLMEAMYCGLPVVASAVKGHVDLIEDGENGLLYPYGDSGAFAAQVARLAGDGALRERLGWRAAQDSRGFALETVLPDVMERYLSVAK